MALQSLLSSNLHSKIDTLACRFSWERHACFYFFAGKEVPIGATLT